jgi:hypothetical protein
MVHEPNNWSVYRSGETIGKPGSEDGAILEDEEYASSARITLESGGYVAPFAITCGVYGLLVHTRFFSEEDKARGEYVEMKADLGRIVDLATAVGTSEEDKLTNAAAQFVERFPT